MKLTDTIVMVEPRDFAFNEEAATTNAFPSPPKAGEDVRALAMAEYQHAVQLLREAGVRTFSLASPTKTAPDAVFPNNVFATFAGNDAGESELISFPMLHESRRHELDVDKIENAIAAAGIYLRRQRRLVAPSRSRALEGTGALVLDREEQRAYVGLSPRADRGLAAEFCRMVGYELTAFHTADGHGNPIYHTNVVLGLGPDYAVVCLEAIPDPKERDEVCQRLTAGGRTIVAISFAQMGAMAANLIALKNLDGEALTVVSEGAWQSFDAADKKVLLKNTAIQPIPVPTIERVGGGSIRCMIAEIFYGVSVESSASSTIG